MAKRPCWTLLRGLPLARLPVHLKPRRDERGVSEVVGSVILLVITVAAFAVLFVMVQGLPKPQPGISADLQATLERTTPTNVTLVIRHLGAADLANGSTWIAVAV